MEISSVGDTILMKQRLIESPTTDNSINRAVNGHIQNVQIIINYKINKGTKI